MSDPDDRPEEHTAQRPAEAQGPAPGERPRLLRRSRTDRVIAGVAGGIGNYFGIDPVLVRVGFVILVLAGGSGILLYLIAWLVMPKATEGEEAEARARAVDADTVRLAVGGGLIALGGILLATRFIPHFSRIFWPLVLVAAGVFVVAQAVRR